MTGEPYTRRWPAVTDPLADPDRRAWHCAHATAGPDEEVAEELISSASRALRRGGVAAAAAFWERAVALTPDPGERASRALTAAEAKYAAGDFEAAQALLVTAELGPLGELGEARVQRMRAQIAFALRRGGDAPPLMLRAAQRLQSLDAELARQTYLEALVAAIYAGRLARGQDARQVARAARSATLPPSGSRAAAALAAAHPRPRRAPGRWVPGRRPHAQGGTAPLPGAAARAGLAVRLVQHRRHGPVGRRGVVRARGRPGSGWRARTAPSAGFRSRWTISPRSTSRPASCRRRRPC